MVITEKVTEIFYILRQFGISNLSSNVCFIHFTIL